MKTARRIRPSNSKAWGQPVDPEEWTPDLSDPVAQQLYAERMRPIEAAWEAQEAERVRVYQEKKAWRLAHG